jgi:hypothetical protein
MNEKSDSFGYEIHVYHQLRDLNGLLRLLNDAYASGATSFAEASVIDLNLVASYFHIGCACAHTLQNHHNKEMKFKSLWEETQHWLSGTSKLSDSIEQYAVTSSTERLAIIRYILPNREMDCRAASFLSNLSTLLRDTATELSTDPLDPSLSAASLSPEKLAELTKLFKLTTAEVKCAGIENSIAMRLATKECL